MMLKFLLVCNCSWVLQKCQYDLDYFEKWVDGQWFYLLWIGCFDSCVFVEVFIGSQFGEFFVYCNIVNMFDFVDDNVMSVLQYVFDYFEVEWVVFCGYYGCGGVQVVFFLFILLLVQEFLVLVCCIGQLCYILYYEIVQIVDDCCVVVFFGVSISVSVNVECFCYVLDVLVEVNVCVQFVFLLESELVQMVFVSG